MCPFSSGPPTGVDEEGVGRALSCCPSVNTGGGTVVGAQEVAVCHPLLDAVDAGREVVEDEYFFSVDFSVGGDVDVRHIDPFLLGKAVSD